MHQRWLFEENWRIQWVGEELRDLAIPFGKTYFLKPHSSRRVLLPWLIHGLSFCILNSCHVMDVLTSYQYSPKSGELSVKLFNGSSHEAVISSKTRAITVKSSAPFEIHTLPGYGKKKRIPIKSVKSLEIAKEIKDDIFDVSTWALQYPIVFGQKQPGCKDIMDEIRILPQDFHLQGSISTEYGSSLNVLKLISPEVLQKTMDEYIAAEFFEEITPEQWIYKSPVIFLPKDNGKRARLVNDYRRLNCHFAVPREDLISVAQVIQSIPAHWTRYAVLDIANGFFSIPLDPSIRHLFGFSIGNQRFQWCVIPQGWCLSSGLFHERIGRIINAIPGAAQDPPCRHYIDDVIIGGATDAEFAHNMHRVLHQFQIYGIHLQLKKIRMSKRSITYLGFDIIGGGGITCSSYISSKQEAFLSPVRTINDLRSRLGVLNVIRKYVPNLAEITSELLPYLKKTEDQFPEHAVTDKIRKIWHLILQRLCKIQLRNVTATQFHLYTDWSTVSCAYALFFQDEGGLLQLTDLHSVKMPDLTKMSSFLGEITAIKFGLESSRHLLANFPMTVHTDNKALAEKLGRFEDNFMDIRITRIICWIQSNFPQVQFRFVPSHQNQLADLLSRFQGSTAVQCNYVAIGDRLIDVDLPSRRIDKPEAAESLIFAAHARHWGTQRTYENLLIDLQGKWPRMKEDVQDFVNKCRSCQLHGEPQVRDDLQGIISYYPNNIVHLDFCGPFRNGQHILVGIDNFSPFIQAVHASSPSATTVVNFLEAWAQSTESWKAFSQTRH